jgi:hypothetical protein
MSNAASWPDLKRLGYPREPEKPGPHLIVLKHGNRSWAWWNSHSEFWMITGDGTTGASVAQAAEDWAYVGPALTPDGVPL